MKVYRRGMRLLFASIVGLVLTGSGWPLHPLVEVKNPPPPRPPSSKCQESLAPSTLTRLEPAQIPEPEQPLAVVRAAAALPATTTLRSELVAAHTALTTNDRPAFDEHLKASEALLTHHPAGAGKVAAEEVVRLLGDAGRIWDAQFRSPFFDEQSDLLPRLRRHPGYEDAVRRSILTDDAERRFYPAAESRDFLTRQVGARLQTLGFRSEAKVARDERAPAARATPVPAPSASAQPRTSPSAPSAKPAARTAVSSSSPERRTSTSTPSRSSKSRTRKPTKPASERAARTTPPKAASVHPSPKSEPTTASRSTATAPVAVSSPPFPAPTTGVSTPVRTSAAGTPERAAPAAVTTTPLVTTASSHPATVSTPAAIETSPAELHDAVPPPADPVTETASTTTAMAADTTTVITATEATGETKAPLETAVVPDPQQRSVVVPALLILIGLGVLVVLFRASK